MSVVRLHVTLTVDDLPVHEWTRASTNNSAAGVAAMLGAMLGWGQAYQGALNEQQWQNDLKRVGAGEPLPSEIAARLAADLA